MVGNAYMKNEKLDPLTPLGRRVLNEVKDRENEPTRPVPTGQIRLAQEVVQLHLRVGKPVNPEKALMMYVMQNAIDEWDNKMGLGIVHGEDW